MGPYCKEPRRERRQLRVGYILKRFPRLSETFILNELLELQRQGVWVEVFALMRPAEEARHELLQQLRMPVFYMPRRKALESAFLVEEMEPAAWSDRNGAPLPKSLQQLTGSLHDNLATLFAGKTPEEISLRWMQASTIALLCASRGIDHMHAHFGTDAALVALMAARLNNISFSYTAHARDIYHTYVSPEVDDERRRLLIREAAFVTTVSEYNRAHLAAQAYAGDGARIRRLYNGINLERFHPRHDIGHSGHFVAVGRLVEKKGFSDLIAACRLLAQREQAFTVSIIGEGPERQRLEAEIAAAGLQHQIRLCGALTQQQVIDVLISAAALVLPCVVCPSGDRDGLPTVLLEAMAMGLPTISTRVAGIPEIIDHERTGLLVPERQPAALADAMAALLVAPRRQRELGTAGRKKAEQLFDLRQNVGQLKDYFRAASERQQQGVENENRLYCC